MRLHRFILLGLLGGCAATSDRPTLEGFRSGALRSEEEGGWRRIDWQKDMKAALEEARKQTKPILAVLVVGHRGQKGAAEC